MKISNLTAKTSLEIQDTDILVIEDAEGTKQMTVGEFKEYLMNNGITKSTKMLINNMMDNVIDSLKASKYVISELITHKMSVTIKDAASGDIYITLQNAGTQKWLTCEEIKMLLAPNEDGYYTKNFVINIMVDDVYVPCVSYSIHDANEINEVMPEGNIGYICAHYEGLTQNEIAGITYDDIMIVLENTELTIVIPVEDMHEYQFVGDPDMFNNNVPYVQKLG